MADQKKKKSLSSLDLPYKKIKKRQGIFGLDSQFQLLDVDLEIYLSVVSTSLPAFKLFAKVNTKVEMP